MTTTKKRINISVPDDVDRILMKLAKRDRMPQATKAAHLLEIALQFEEDALWDEIARTRDKKETKFIPHKNAWLHQA